MLARLMTPQSVLSILVVFLITATLCSGRAAELLILAEVWMFALEAADV